MKKLLFLLLFVPLISFSQITYKDIMYINSEKTYKKVVIENGYEFDSADDDVIWYGWNITKDSINGNKSKKWSTYTKSTGAFIFQFSRTNVLADFLKSDSDNSKNEYDLIVEDIKAKCKYFDVITDEANISYVTYSCSESSYKGKIGFMVSEGTGFIVHFPED